MALLTKVELLELERVRRKVDIVTNEYLLDPNDPNFEYIRDKYFDGYKKEDSINKTQLHNVGSGIGYSVASVMSYFVGNPIGELDLDLTMATQDTVGTGYGVLVLEKINGQYKSSYIPAFNYVLRDGQHYVYRFYTAERQDNTEDVDLYVLEQLYGVAGTEGFIKNRLIKFNSTTDLNFIASTNGQQVPLDSIEQTTGMEEIVKTGLDVPAIFIPSFRENVCENISLIDKIRNLIYSIDRNMVEFDNQFGMNMAQYTLFKNIQPNHIIAKSIKDGRLLDANKIGRMHFSREKDASIEFISNKNEMIDQSMAYEEKKYMKISGITSIPLDFLQGEASSGAIGQGSRSILHGAFIKQIKSYRELWEPVINEIYEAVAKADSTLNIEWMRPDMFSKDENELVLELTSAITAGLISQKKAVMKYQDINEKELEEEILRIKEDNLLITNGGVNEVSGNQAMTSGEEAQGGNQNFNA